MLDGHCVKYCRVVLSYARCGQANHEADDCDESNWSCFNCREDHFTGSKMFREMEKEKEILCIIIQNKERVSRGQAMRLFNTRNPNYHMNYSDAVSRTDASEVGEMPRSLVPGDPPTDAR